MRLSSWETPCFQSPTAAERRQFIQDPHISSHWVSGRHVCHIPRVRFNLRQQENVGEAERISTGLPRAINVRATTA